MTGEKWDVVPVADLAVSKYRGRTIEIDGEWFVFTGTSRATVASLSPNFIGVHGHSDGRSVTRVVRETASVRVRVEPP